MSNPNPRYYRCDGDFHGPWILNFEHLLTMSRPSTVPSLVGQFVTVHVICASGLHLDLEVPADEVDALFAAFEHWLSQR